MQNKIINIFLLIFILTASLNAGEYHGQADMLCSDCHTTYYSERGALLEKAEPGGPFPEMLLVSSIDKLCLSCHDGTDPAAPDVLAPVTMYDGSGSEFSGAGFFSAQSGIVSGNAHDLGVHAEIPYSMPPRNMTLSCVSCHNPHGTTNYRNLILNPDSSGADITLAAGTDVFENNHPAIPPERNSSISAYKGGNMGYRSNISAWCSDCHNGLSIDNPGNPPAHFQRHPSGIGFDGLNPHANSTHWMTGSGDGFGTATDDGTEGVPRLRFQAPNAGDFNQATTVARDNQVFCYSCHFAHGGPFKSALVWPFRTTGSADLYSGCQQCHYK